MIRLVAAFIVSLVAVPLAASAQTFGQFTTAAISTEGEGGAFVSAGRDALRTGVMARFSMTGRTDFALQFGYDSECDENSFGGGADLKYYLLSRESDFPVDMALDAALGYHRSNDFARSRFGLGLLASGLLTADTPVSLEPYASVIVSSTYFTERPPCGRNRSSCWPCEDDDWNTINDMVLRAGLKISLSDEYNVFVEVEVDGGTSFGGALNVVF